MINRLAYQITAMSVTTPITTTAAATHIHHSPGTHARYPHNGHPVLSEQLKLPGLGNEDHAQDSQQHGKRDDVEEEQHDGDDGATALSGSLDLPQGKVSGDDRERPEQRAQQGEGTHDDRQ